MTKPRKFILGLMGIWCIALGMYLSSFYTDFPYLTLDNEVNVIDAATLFFTIFIGLMIPIWVQKIMEDTKGIKVFFVDEMKELIQIFEALPSLLSESYSLGKFKKEDRNKIIHVFHDAEVKIVSIEAQLNVSFKKESVELCKKMKELLLAYKNYLTGGELMVSTFNKIDERFYRENKAEYNKLASGLKVLIQDIHRL